MNQNPEIADALLEMRDSLYAVRAAAERSNFEREARAHRGLREVTDEHSAVEVRDCFDRLFPDCADDVVLIGIREDVQRAAATELAEQITDAELREQAGDGKALTEQQAVARNVLWKRERQSDKDTLHFL